MSKILDLGHGTHLSVSALAAEFGHDRATVRSRLADAGIKPSGSRSGYPVFRLKDALPALIGTPSDPDSMDPFRRRAYYQGEISKLSVAVERGELIPRLEVESEMAAMMKICAEFFDCLPDTLERDCALGPGAVAKVEACLDRVRQELYDRLAAPDGDADEAG